MRNEDQKIVDVENNPVSKLLGGLKRVEAPGDFDFRVKARIANGRPVETTSWFPTVIRLAVPLALLLFIGGYFGFNALYSPKNIAVAPVADFHSADTALIGDVTSIEPGSLPVKQGIAGLVENKPVELGNKVTSKPNEKRIVSSEPSNRQPGGGSYDTASRAPRQIFPKGLDPNRKISTVPKDVNKSTNVSAKDILSFMGIDADSSWKVGSVKKNSLAERSGLKAGDVIEAINDQNLTEKTVFGNKFSSKSIRVRRDGKSVQIELKP